MRKQPIKQKNPVLKSWVVEGDQKYLPPALPVATYTELVNLGITTEEIAKGESRGKLETFGPWQQPLSFKALAMSCVFGEHSGVLSAKAYGLRTLINARQSGYCLEGWVTISGRKYSAFTSSKLFELPDKKLVNVATIHVRIGNDLVKQKFKADINLDDPEECREFVEKNSNTTGRTLAVRLGFRGPGAIDAALSLRGYACNKRTAMALRLTGQIVEAQKYEAICDRVYRENIKPNIECW